MSALIENLRNFNRKERYYLLNTALNTDNFKLSDEFRSVLDGVLDLRIPETCFAAMDYHLNWIYAGLCLSYIEETSTKGLPQNKTILESNQEDVDLLIAFRDGIVNHIIMIEAKADTSWRKKQLLSKIQRLNAIFDVREWQEIVRPHFILMSPNRPKNIEANELPDWAKKQQTTNWIPLEMPKRLKKVTYGNCNKRFEIIG